MLDIAYPFASAWMKAVGALETTPTPEWIATTPVRCECSQEQMLRFLQDLWWILRMKLAGRAHDIVLHVAETHTTAMERELRVPRAWFALEREA